MWNGKWKKLIFDENFSGSELRRRHTAHTPNVTGPAASRLGPVKPLGNLSIMGGSDVANASHLQQSSDASKATTSSPALIPRPGPSGQLQRRKTLIDSEDLNTEQGIHLNTDQVEFIWTLNK